jgi:hypothetical protein
MLVPIIVLSVLTKHPPMPPFGSLWQVSDLLYNGLFSRGVQYADFAERAQFANFETTILESGCGLVAALLRYFAEALAASKSRWVHLVVYSCSNHEDYDNYGHNIIRTCTLQF